MPAPGDQHNGIANPFEETKPRISEFTAQQIATLQSRLEKQLGPEYISSRTGPGGGKVHYITAEKVISLANEVFGFNGWSSSIQNIQVDFVDENPQTLKVSLGLSVIVRVTLRDGCYHEDLGYGQIDNCRGKAAAFEKAKKEGTTDALKRALRNFGNVLGNCIYDKDYLQKVTKLKAGPTKFNVDNLHRHADFAKKVEDPAPTLPPLPAPVKSEPGKTDYTKGAPPITTSDSLDDDFGDFDMADFGVTEDGHPDEVSLPASHGARSNEATPNITAGNAAPPNNGPAARPMAPPSRPPGRGPPNLQPSRGPQTPNQTLQRPGPHGRPFPQQPTPGRQPNLNGGQTVSHASTTANMPSTNNNPPEPTAGFFSARSVNPEAEGAAAPGPGSAAAKFNPHAESPSIRKTPGIDHKSSRPVAKNGQHVEPIKHDQDEEHAGNPGPGNAGRPPQGTGGLGNAAAGRPAVGGMGNPVLSQTRRIGAPGGGGSPLANRGQYKPPTMKRPAPGTGPVDTNGSGNRIPLTDVSTNGPVSGAGVAGGAVGAGVDAKRQKTT